MSKGCVTDREIDWSLDSQEKELVSVIVDVSSVDFLKQTLESVINQIYSNLQIIIIDDCLEKPIRSEFLIDDRIYIVRHDDARWGLSISLNTGLQNARGKYICYIDSGDEFKPEFVEKMVKALDGRKERLVYCDCQLVEKGVNQGVYQPGNYDKKELMDVAYIFLPFILHEKSLIKETGWFDVKLNYYQDWDFLRRASQVTDFFYFPERLVVCEQSNRNLDFNLGAEVVSKDLDYIKAKGLIENET